MRTYLRYLLSLGLWSGFAHADLSGTWKGSGRAWTSDGWDRDCEIQISITHRREKLKAEGELLCGGYTFSWGLGSAQIKGRDLIVGDEKVGEITENKMTARVNNGRYDGAYEITKLKDGSLDIYQEELELGYFTKYEGNLAK